MLLTKVYAQLNEVSVPTLSGVNQLSDVFAIAINIVLGIGVTLTVIYLILGGIQYMTAKGDQKAAAEARQALTNAVIGFIVVIGAFTIRNLVANVIGGGGVDIDTVTPENTAL